jgi:hypothetical protein
MCCRVRIMHKSYLRIPQPALQRCHVRYKVCAHILQQCTTCVVCHLRQQLREQEADTGHRA